MNYYQDLSNTSLKRRQQGLGDTAVSISELTGTVIATPFSATLRSGEVVRATSREELVSKVDAAVKEAE